jgi:hypothetical protein
MTESDVVAALRPVAEALDALCVRHFLGGSIASSAHGVARAGLGATYRNWNCTVCGVGSPDAVKLKAYMPV